MTSHLPDRDGRYQRHLGIAADLAGKAPEEILTKFKRSRVVLTGQAETLATRPGRIMLLTTANLISRFCPNIDLVLPEALPDLAVETLKLLQGIDSSPEAEFRVLREPEKGAKAVLAIGTTTAALPRLTSISSNGWRGHVCQGPLPPRSDTDGNAADENPFGALVAAALGAAEVFKYLLDPLPGKAFFLDATSLSAYDYSVGGDDPGPPLPSEIRLPRSLLAGVGAVGNAFLLALSHLPSVSGDLIVVDDQVVDSKATNLNRYVLASEADTKEGQETPKTELAVRLFRGRTLRVDPQQRRIEAVLDRTYAKEIRRPKVILSAVDNNDSRYLLQKLWPDLVLEGATDCTLAQVSRHEYGTGRACLMCIHSSPARAEGANSYLAAAAERTGLRSARIQEAERNASLTVVEGDVAHAPPEKREFLAEHLGRPICGLLTETAAVSENKEAPPQVAVSFTSMLAGVLQAAELVKYAAGFGTTLGTFFQIDPMQPLRNAILQTVNGTHSCYCHQRHEEIRRYRDAVAEPAERAESI